MAHADRLIGFAFAAVGRAVHGKGVAIAHLNQAPPKLIGNTAIVGVADGSRQLAVFN